MRITGKLCETGELVAVETAGGCIASVTRCSERPVAADLGGPPGPRFRGGGDDSSEEPGAADLGGSDVWLAPGFCDLQLNGYGGYDFNTRAWSAADEVSREIAPIFRLAAAAGTALLCPTVTTGSFEAMSGSLARIARCLDAEPSLAGAVPGLHVEGPYLSSEDGPRGAHPREHTRDPDWEEFQRLQEAAGGRIRVFTLAPERDGALAFIEKLVAAGVVVSLGHTGADPGTIRDAVLAGATMSTHLGNGAHAQLARHPNYIWEQLAHDGLIASVIPDGHHLPPSVLKCIARVKGAERLALVSDAVSLGGMPPGRYAGGEHEVLPSGKIVVAGTPYLAGAGHLLDTCVANMLRYTDLSLAEVVRCVTEVPARILGLSAKKGSIRVGYDADLTLFRTREEGPLEIVATVRAGIAN